MKFPEELRGNLQSRNLRGESRLPEPVRNIFSKGRSAIDPSVVAGQWGEKSSYEFPQIFTHLCLDRSWDLLVDGRLAA
jgi:hypothetical protein